MGFLKAPAPCVLGLSFYAQAKTAPGNRASATVCGVVGSTVLIES
jgi:hypothetical protein